MTILMTIVTQTFITNFLNSCTLSLFFNIYFWPYWVLVAAQGFSLVAASQGCSSVVA